MVIKVKLSRRSLQISVDPLQSSSLRNSYTPVLQQKQFLYFKEITFKGLPKIWIPWKYIHFQQLLRSIEATLSN